MERNAPLNVILIRVLAVNLEYPFLLTVNAYMLSATSKDYGVTISMEKFSGKRDIHLRGMFILMMTERLPA